VAPEGTPDGKLEFSTELKLKPGLNTVTVFAREDEEFQSRRSLVIFRRTPAAVAERTTPGGATTRTP
jgi:carboxyl-terminal processing protease